MPHIPAICDRCGTMFPSGFVFENARNVTLSGNRSGPCPSCGGMGHVPVCVYDFVDGAIALLQGPERTVSELQRLASLLRAAKAHGATADEVKSAIREQVSGIQGVGDLLPKTPSDLYAFITVLLTIIGLVLSA